MDSQTLQETYAGVEFYAIKDVEGDWWTSTESAETGFQLDDNRRARPRTLEHVEREYGILDDGETERTREAPCAQRDGYSWTLTDLRPFMQRANDIAADFAASARRVQETINTTSDDALDALRERFAPERSTIATEAQAAVYGDREDDYGHPRDNFTVVAQMWTVLLQDRLEDGAYITPEDVARCMIGTKLARDLHSPKRDNRVDMAGYAITLDRLETGQ